MTGVGMPDAAGVHVSAEMLLGEPADVILPEAEQSANWYSLNWDVPADLPRGIYNVRRTADDESSGRNDSTRTVIVLRDAPVVQPVRLTGSDGTADLTDPEVFAQLRWNGSVLLPDDSGSSVAPITALQRVLIEVRDPDTSQTETYEREILESTEAVELMWPASSSPTAR